MAGPEGARLALAGAAGPLSQVDLEVAYAEQRLAEAKRLATAIARAALRGIVLPRIEVEARGVVFIASKEVLMRQLANLPAAEAWLDSIGAPG